MATIPGAKWLLVAIADVQDTSGKVEEVCYKGGSESMLGAFDSVFEQFMDFEPAATDTTADDTLLTMPASATVRVRKLNTILRDLFRHEHAGTAHASTKQIYKAVRDGASFAFWDATFPTTPFTTQALASSDTSRNVYIAAAAKLHSVRTGVPLDGGHGEAVEAVEDVVAHEKCVRTMLCSRANRHRGACDKKLPAVQPEEYEYEPAPAPAPAPAPETPAPEGGLTAEEFRAFLTGTHIDEPYKLFTRGQTIAYAALVKKNPSLKRTSIYSMMGVPVSRSYRTWYDEAGSSVWAAIDCRRCEPGVYLEATVDTAPPEPQLQRHAVPKRPAAATAPRTQSTSKKPRLPPKTAAEKKLEEVATAERTRISVLKSRRRVEAAHAALTKRAKRDGHDVHNKAVERALKMQAAKLKKPVHHTQTTKTKQIKKKKTAA